jgi:adenine-specific DNA-methyltransferase
MVNQALTEAETVRPKPAYIIFAAFQFDPSAAKLIDDTKWPGLTLLKVRMNTDLMTADLKKKSSSSQSFWLVGQPDMDLSGRHDTNVQFSEALSLDLFNNPVGYRTSLAKCSAFCHF